MSEAKIGNVPRNEAFGGEGVARGDGADMASLKRAAADAATMPHVALTMAALRGGHPAVVEANRAITYAELAEAMRNAAAAFVKAGLNEGDKVAIWAHNGIDWIVACLGAQAAGGIIVPLNTRFKGDEARHILQRSHARFLVYTRRFLEIDYLALIEGLDLPELERKIALPNTETETETAEWAEFIAAGAADAVVQETAERRLDALRPGDVSDIMFTSGTTGAPKGVVTTHGQNVRTFREWVRSTSLHEEDRYATIWPFFHCSGYKSGWLSNLIAGSTLYPQAMFEMESLVELIAREKITVLPGPPTLFNSLLASPKRRDGSLQSLRVAVTGATMISPDLIRAIRDELGVDSVLAGYGLTETCGTVTMTSREDSAEIVATSPGKAIPGTEVAIVGDRGEFLPRGSGGEIVVRGYNVMQGYFEDEQATAETIDPNGWLHTGDLGEIDNAGYLKITGRKKDVYIVGGFNCYPAEIEDAIARHPTVAEVAVIGIPDERLGEVGKAFVVLRDRTEPLSEAQLISWCRDNMANYKVPRAVTFVDALPRTPTAKVQKFRLQNGEFG